MMMIFFLAVLLINLIFFSWLKKTCVAVGINVKGGKRGGDFLHQAVSSFSFQLNQPQGGGGWGLQ